MYVHMYIHTCSKYLIQMINISATECHPWPNVNLREK
jgi:hypothetical protein